MQVGCISQSLKIGDSNILEAKSFVGRNMNLSNGCIVGAGCRLTAEETLAENSVVYGGVCSRRLAKERPAPQTLQIDFLSKVCFQLSFDSLITIIFEGSSKLPSLEKASQEARSRPSCGLLLTERLRL